MDDAGEEGCMGTAEALKHCDISPGNYIKCNNAPAVRGFPCSRADEDPEFRQVFVLESLL